MSRLKLIGIPAVAAGALAVVEYGRKTLETFHILDFITHLNDSPTLAKVQLYLGTRSGLAALVATIVVLGSALFHVWRDRRQVHGTLPEGRKAGVSEHRVIVEPRDTMSARRRKVTVVYEEREEVFRRSTRRYVVEEDNPDP